jgi:small subunit ribosomal protein S24e
MDVEILEKKENPLLERTEVRFKLAFEGATPSRQDVRKKLAAVLNSDKSLTVIADLKSAYGSKTAQGYAKVYDNEKALRKEPEYVIKRNIVEEKPTEEPTKEQTTEKPAEKPTEEPTKEQTTEKPAEEQTKEAKEEKAGVDDIGGKKDAEVESSTQQEKELVAESTDADSKDGGK